MKNTTPARKLGNDTLGRERRKDLNQRITAVTPYRIENRPDPPRIAAARKIVDAHDSRESTRSRKMREESRRAAENARRAVLHTDSYDEALRIVTALEATAKRRGWLGDI